MRKVLQIPFIGSGVVGIDPPTPAELRLMHDTWLYAMERGWEYIEIGVRQYMAASTYIPYERYMGLYPELAEFVDSCDFAHGHEAQLISDFVRLHFAAHSRDLFYIDRDGAPIDLPDFKQGSVWFARYSKHTIDHCAFYADDPGFFEDLLAVIMRKLPRAEDGRVVVGWASIHALIIELCLGKVEVLEPECFTHMHRSKAA